MVPLSRLHFTRYNMSAPWRLGLANNYLCPKQVKWHVSEDGSPTSDLYFLPCLEGSYVQVGRFSGGVICSLCTSMHPSRRWILHSSSGCWRQQRENKGDGLSSRLLRSELPPLQLGDLSAQHSGHHISSSFAQMDAFIGRLSTPWAACFENVRALIKKGNMQL